MPYDPTLPVANSPVVSAELRNQFAGLKELVDLCATPDWVETQILNETAGAIQPVDTMVLAPSDPPTQSDLQTVIDKINEMIAYLKRA